MEFDQTVEQRQIRAPSRSGVSASWRTLLARAGVVGFAFFLLKGLLWLAVPYLLFLIGTGN